MDVQIEQGAPGAAMGSIASRLMQANMDVKALRPWIGNDGKTYINVNGKATQIFGNATLRKDEWIATDAAVIAAVQERLVGVADLYQSGLVYRIGNGMGKTVLEYEDQSDITAAALSMDGLNRGENDRPVYDLKYLPLPITHKDYQINARALAASRNGSTPLDTTMAALSGRQIAEKLEDMLFNGTSSYTFGGGTIYGYTDFPSANSVTLSQNWDASGKTGQEILEDILAMKQALIDDSYYGPYMVYIPTAYETKLDEDFGTVTSEANTKTIRERILAVNNINGIKVADKLTANKVVMVQMTSDVVRMVNGLDPQMVSWDVEGGMAMNFKVMTIQVPQLRADQSGKCGIAILSA